MQKLDLDISLAERLFRWDCRYATKQASCQGFFSTLLPKIKKCAKICIAGEPCPTLRGGRTAIPQEYGMGDVSMLSILKTQETRKWYDRIKSTAACNGRIKLSGMDQGRSYRHPSPTREG